MEQRRKYSPYKGKVYFCAYFSPHLNKDFIVFNRLCIKIFEVQIAAWELSMFSASFSACGKNDLGLLLFLLLNSSRPKSKHDVVAKSSIEDGPHRLPCGIVIKLSDGVIFNFDDDNNLRFNLARFFF